MEKKSIWSKDFQLMAIGQIISLFGNQILRFALPLYLLHQTGSAALFGTISAISFIPMLILFPIGGIIADRVSKRNIMVILDFCTAALVFIFLLLSGEFNIVPLIAATLLLLYAIQGTYQPAVKASIPALVDKESFMQANSVVDVISSSANMIGPVVGGLLFATIGLSAILYICVGCFCVSAVMEMFIHIPFGKRQVQGGIIASGLADIGESFRYIFKTKPIIWKMSVTYGLVSLFLCSLFVIALPVLITQTLGFSPSTANRLYGYAEGVIAVGSVAGGLLAGVLSKKLNAKIIPGFIIGSALSILIGGMALHLFHSRLVVYAVLVFACSALMIFSSLFQIQMMSYIQVLTPNDLIGKVISCVICVCMCSNPIGQCIYGIVFEDIGDYSYLPFYVAALLVTTVGILTRSVFYEVEAELVQVLKQSVSD